MKSYQEVLAARERLGLSNGQMHVEPFIKNAWWILDGQEIGAGDLSERDILDFIAESLLPGETFEAFNELRRPDDIPRVRLVMRKNEAIAELSMPQDEERKKRVRLLVESTIVNLQKGNRNV